MEISPRVFPEIVLGLLLEFFLDAFLRVSLWNLPQIAPGLLPGITAPGIPSETSSRITPYIALSISLGIPSLFHPKYPLKFSPGIHSQIPPGFFRFLCQDLYKNFSSIPEEIHPAFFCDWFPDSS